MFITLFQQPREREPATSPNQTTVFTEGEHGEGNKVMEKHTGCACVGNYLKSLAGNIVSRLRDLFLKVLQSCRVSRNPRCVIYISPVMQLTIMTSRDLFAFFVIVISFTLR